VSSVVEVHEPGAQPRRVEVHDAIELGREGDGILVVDPRVSRRHLRLASREGRLTVTDLGSANGTAVNGVAITTETQLQQGDTIQAGGVELRVIEVPEPPREPARPTEAPPTARPTPPQPAVRPALEELASVGAGAATIRYRPGSTGEQFAKSVGDSARRARHRLEGLGSEPWGIKPSICLSDPFPDPARPGEIVAEGTIVDAERGEIWMVVTSESPPEPLERPLALLFGAALPAAADLELLLEGYGLHLAGTPDPNPQLRELELPPLDAAEGELRSAMTTSFVRWLVERGGRDDFLQLLTRSQPGRVDAVAQDVYGQGLVALEEAWQQHLAAGEPDVKMGQFLRLVTRYLRPHMRREIEMFVYMLFGLGFTVVFPFAFRKLVDDAIPKGDLGESLAIIGVLAVALAISLLAGLRRTYLSAYVSSSVVRELRTRMFVRLQELSSGWFAHRQQGDILSRLFSDVMVLENGLSQTLREGAFQVLSLIVSAIVLMILNPLLGGIVLLGAPLVGLVYKAMAKGAQKRSIAVQEQTGHVFTVAGENYSAQSVVKAFGLERREAARFGQASDRLFRNEIRLQLFGGLFGLSVNGIVTALRLTVLGLGSWLIIDGHLTIGGLVAFISLMGEVISPVTVLTGIGQQVQASTGALVRINEILEALPDVADASDATQLPPLTREIRLAAVGFSYTAERKTLEGVDARITAGSRVAFVGSTGAGKSSVLQLLMRFYDPDEGAVLFDGVDLRRATVASLRGQLGVVFQETFLFDATIAENIALGKPGASDAEIEAAARAAELHDFIVTLPRGYHTMVGERGGRLSGGQRQRVSIARAVLRDPRVLLLDEATSALDPRTERLIADTLEKIGHGRTTIAVTHRMTSVTEYDQIFVIDNGHLAEHGTHDELLSVNGLYARLWEEQVGGHVPTEAPFAVEEALARLSLFSELDEADFALVAARLQPITLTPGETLPEGGGRIVVVRHGRAKTLVPDFTGRLVPVADLGPGDAFGLTALLGHPTGAVMQAVDEVRLLALDDEAIAGLAATISSVGAALDGRRPEPAVPAGGTRLPRMTMASMVVPAPPAPPPVNVDEIRRASGAFLSVRP